MTNMYMYLIRVVCSMLSYCILCNGISVLEGDVAKLDFPYPCNSTEVTLQCSNGRPFYSSANPDVDSLPSRYEVRNHTESNSDVCRLNFTINPVSRDDECTFILFAYKDGVILPEYPRIWLDVDYPPGKPSCESNNDYVDGEGVKLYCQAPLGTIPGQIVCYQDDERLPSLTSPGENGDKLNQIILARLAGLVYCCTSTFQQTKNRCECNGFRWNPILNIELSNIPNPCADVTEMADSVTSFIDQDQETSTIHPNALDPKTGKNNRATNHWWFYVLITILCLAVPVGIATIVFLFARATCTCKKKKKSSKKESNTGNESEEHELNGVARG